MVVSGAMGASLIEIRGGRGFSRGAVLFEAPEPTNPDPSGYGTTVVGTDPMTPGETYPSDSTEQPVYQPPIDFSE